MCLLLDTVRHRAFVDAFRPSAYMPCDATDALINSVTWLYGAETQPLLIRSKMVGLSAVCHYVVNVARECREHVLADIGRQWSDELLQSLRPLQAPSPPL